jgi:hypothetical protein
MNEPTLDIQGLLRALVEQQTALLGVHAESMRLQRVLVERLLASGSAQTVTADAAQTIVAQTPHDSSERMATATPAVEAVVRDESVPAVEASAPTVPAVGDGPLAESQQTAAPVSTPAPGERPALRVVGGTAGRGERYYQSPQQTPVHRISCEGLDVLKRIQSAETAQLILVFGPHAGETLGQVAQTDPDYVRRLALTAQRPDVRAAAAQVASALGEPAAPPRRPRAGWRRASNSAR